jgi:phosphoribosyl 1,2-cyclic phosphodiesterase
MLAGSSYPESVKARVGSRFGHLNNDQAVELLADLMHANLQWIAGLHLSERNNSPALVRDAVAPLTRRAGIELHLAAQDEASGWLSIA